MGDFWFANSLRAIVIFLCIYSMWMCFYTCFIYYRRTALEIKNFLPFMSNLMLHIYLAAGFAVLISFYAIFDMYSRFNFPLTWRSPFLTVTFLLLAISQRQVSAVQLENFLRRKDQIAKAKERILVEEKIKEMENKQN